MNFSQRIAPYPIAAVSKLTGINCHTLRVWERRYGFPNPVRTDSGHRRYLADQVCRLQEVAQRIRNGESLGKVIVEVRDSPCRSATSRTSVVTTRLEVAERVIRALRQADFREAELVFQEALDCGTPESVAASILVPALTETGELWFRGDSNLCETRSLSVFLLRKLGTLLDLVQSSNQDPRGNVLTLAVQGDAHEGGVALLSLALELRGWRAINLGADVPVEAIQCAIDLWQPIAVGVSLSLSRNITKRFQELGEVRGAPVIVGGRSVINYQSMGRKYGLQIVPGDVLEVIGPVMESLLKKQRSN